jgi:hypothetical protein
MAVVVDLTGVSVGGGAPLEADVYPAIITKAEIGLSKSSNEPKIDFEFGIGEEGRPAYLTISLQQKVLWRFKQILMRLGVEIPEGSFDVEELAPDLVGLECQLRLSVEPSYRDPQRMVNKVMEVLGPDDEDGGGGWE